jgi:hypothetical protein
MCISAYKMNKYSVPHSPLPSSASPLPPDQEARAEIPSPCVESDEALNHYRRGVPELSQPIPRHSNSDERLVLVAQAAAQEAAKAELKRLTLIALQTAAEAVKEALTGINSAAKAAAQEAAKAELKRLTLIVAQAAAEAAEEAAKALNVVAQAAYDRAEYLLQDAELMKAPVEFSDEDPDYEDDSEYESDYDPFNGSYQSNCLTANKKSEEAYAKLGEELEGLADALYEVYKGKKKAYRAAKQKAEDLKGTIGKVAIPLGSRRQALEALNRLELDAEEAAGKAEKAAEEAKVEKKIAEDERDGLIEIEQTMYVRQSELLEVDARAEKAKLMEKYVASAATAARGKANEAKRAVSEAIKHLSAIKTKASPEEEAIDDCFPSMGSTIQRSAWTSFKK